MTKEECKQLLMTMEIIYPNFKVEDKANTLKAWHLILQDYDPKYIEMGLKIYVTSSGSAFAPSIAELIEAAKRPEELQMVDSSTAWSLVRKAISRGLYYAKEEYEKLPELAKEVVGSPAQIRSWAELETREIDTVVWSNFKKSYESLKEKKKQISMLPADVRTLINGTQQKMIGG